jgi:hypothetical protein
MSAGQIVTRLNVREDEHGELFIEACYKSIPCGCEIVGNGTTQAPFSIKYCAIHRVATEALSACRDALSALESLHIYGSTVVRRLVPPERFTMLHTKDDFLRKLVYPTTFDKNKALETHPHYTDDRFKKEQTVFGKEEDGIGYDYSDRLREWDYSKAEASVKAANESGATPRTCKWYEAYLSAYFGKPIEIKHIIAGVNRSNGYPYCVFGYKDAA